MSDEQDKTFIKIAIEIARVSRSKGNHPFGAMLVDQNGHVLLKAENVVVSHKDVTGHAELNLVRMASKKYSKTFLKNCTIYCSAEPCLMCCGAIFWGNIRRIVFGLSEKSLYKLIDNNSEEVFSYPSVDLFKKGKKSIEVIGPLLEIEALEVHRGFWN